MRAALAALVFACTGALAAPAAASGVCDVGVAEAPAERAVVESADLILPCAIAESGLLGPACHDAPMYAVTHAGVVLCQLNLAVVAPGSSTSVLSGQPALPAPHPRSSSQQPALPSAAPLLPAQQTGTAPRAPCAIDAPPADVPPVPPWGPS